ncbi:MAG TPA: VTT domain-containing protein [Nitrospira sp.]|nr:VTT domain-containing protein [Nitrospira sp.]
MQSASALQDTMSEYTRHCVRSTERYALERHQFRSEGTVFAKNKDGKLVICPATNGTEPYTLQRRGAVVAVRVSPVAPFTVVNMIAGATHIRTRDFLSRTVLGELPGLSAIAVFVDQVTTILHSPNLGSYLVLAGSVIVVWGLRCRLSRRAL